MFMKVLLFIPRILFFSITLIGKMLCYVGLGIYALVTKALECLGGLWQRFANPGHHRLGMSAAIARQRQLAEAHEASEQEDWTRAIPCWHHAASLYSNRAMYSLGECYEQGKGVERDLAIAYEFYAMADHYHYGENAKEKCDALKAFAMSRNARKLFRKELHDRWNYNL